MVNVKTIMANFVTDYDKKLETAREVASSKAEFIARNFCLMHNTLGIHKVMVSMGTWSIDHDTIDDAEKDQLITPLEEFLAECRDRNLVFEFDLDEDEEPRIIGINDAMQGRR